ncbi:MAG TPA: hypothetical protein VI036_13885, partial [Propionibacteriaceae bacterium]
MPGVAAGSLRRVIKPQPGVYRLRRARTTTLLRVRAALSRGGCNSSKRGEVAPLVRLVERVFVVR